MRVYRAGTAVSITVPFEWGGVAVIPTSLSYQVLDEDGAELVVDTALPLVDGQTAAIIMVDATANTLAPAAPRGLRLVRLNMTDASGVCTTEARYVLQGDQSLQVMTNTYQTFESALLEAMNMPQLKAWPNKSDDDRRAALIEAYHRLGKLRYRIRNTTVEDELTRIEPRELRYVSDLNGKTLTDFIKYPSRFRQALRRAQIAEADIVLNGDLLGDKRRNGIMSETIGESSMMFRASKPVQTSVSEAALRHLHGYIDYSISVARA